MSADAPRDGVPDGVPHDAWLREALRHAPDAQALPPTTLSETILRQARAAAAGAAQPQPPSFGRRLAAAWSWLGRPPVAAGFASVMVAGVVGLMWWDRPIEESLPPRDAAVPAAAPMATSAPTPPMAAAPAPVPAPAPAAPPAPVAAEPARAPTPAPRRAPAPAVAQAPAREMAPPPAPGLAGAAGATAPPAPRPAEAPAMADATPAPRAAPPPAAAMQESRAGAAAEADARAERSERARTATTLSKAAAPAAPVARRDFAAPSTSFSSVRSAIASQPERWRWSRDGGALRPVHGPLENWLGQLDSTAASRWQPDASDTSASRDEASTRLQLWLDDRLHSTLRLDAGGAVFEPAAPAARQRAALPASAADTLRAALDQATR